MTLEIIIIATLILLGVCLLMIEIFLIPSTTIVGAMGAILLIGSIVYAFYYLGNSAGYITIAINLTISIGAFIYIIKSNTINRIALKTNIDSVVEQPEIKHLSEGEIGVTISRINPIGKAQFANQYIAEVKSVTGEFIDTAQKIKIVKINKNTILVKQTL